MKRILLLGFTLLASAAYAYNPTQATNFESSGVCSGCNLTYYSTQPNPSRHNINIFRSNVTGSTIGSALNENWTTVFMVEIVGKNTVFQGTWDHVEFGGSILYKPVFKGRFTNTSFESAIVSGADFTKAQINGNTNFQSAGLLNANFSNVAADGSNFTSSYLGGAKFFNASLTGANFTSAAIESSTDMRCANLLGATITSGQLALANSGCAISESGVQLPPPSGYTSCAQLCPAQTMQKLKNYQKGK